MRRSEPEPARRFHINLSLANGRRIESSWRFGDVELARLIRIAETFDVRAGAGEQDLHRGEAVDMRSYTQPLQVLHADDHLAADATLLASSPSGSSRVGIKLWLQAHSALESHVLSGLIMHIGRF